VSLPSMHPAWRSKLVLIGLVFLTLLIVASLGRAGTGAAALNLFQSPSSPLSDTTQPAATPIVAAAAQPAASPGLAAPTWLIVLLAAAVVVALVVVFLLVRRARR